MSVPRFPIGKLSVGFTPTLVLGDVRVARPTGGGSGVRKFFGNWARELYQLARGPEVKSTVGQVSDSLATARVAPNFKQTCLTDECGGK